MDRRVLATCRPPQQSTVQHPHVVLPTTACAIEGMQALPLRLWVWRAVEPFSSAQGARPQET